MFGGSAMTSFPMNRNFLSNISKDFKKSRVKFSLYLSQTNYQPASDYGIMGSNESPLGQQNKIEIEKSF